MKSKILIVDDSLSTCHLLQLTIPEYKTIITSSGNKAWEQLQTMKRLPDLILLDMIMKDGGGIELCKKLKHSNRFKSIPVVFITSSEDKKDIIKAYRVGACDYILKPIVRAEVQSRIATQLLNKAQHDTIVHHAYHDALTGLYNRNYFEEELIRVDTQRNYPISVIMVDINNLKVINDTFGHAIGDKMIRCVADVLKREVRQDDVVARLGGDEYVLLLKNTNRCRAVTIAEQCQTHLRTLDCPSKHCQGLPKGLSVAIGVSTNVARNISLQETIMKADEDLYRNKMLADMTTQSELVASLTKMLEYKDKHTTEHGYRIKDLAKKFGCKIGMMNGQIRDLLLLSKLHDIGKIGIPDSILFKPDKLNVQEWETMKTHSIIGYKILTSARQFSQIASYVLHHHERWDGTGYPDALKGRAIPLHSRIITILDTFDTIISGRPYKKGETLRWALDEIVHCSGTQFDPELVNIFMELMNEEFRIRWDDAIEAITGKKLKRRSTCKQGTLKLYI